MLKEAVVATVQNYHGTCPKGLTKRMNNHNQDSQSPTEIQTWEQLNMKLDTYSITVFS